MASAGKQTATRARQLVDGASFGPEALKAISAAFDAAWAEICGNFGDDPADLEKARVRFGQGRAVDCQRREP